MDALFNSIVNRQRQNSLQNCFRLKYVLMVWLLEYNMLDSILGQGEVKWKKEIYPVHEKLCPVKHELERDRVWLVAWRRRVVEVNN